MSYAKAMKHARSIRKCRKQSRMYFGFDSCSGPTKAASASPLLGPLLNTRRWFQDRRDDHPGSAGYRYRRECVREAIAAYRSAVRAQHGVDTNG